MKAIVTPYFEAQGPWQFLQRGRFVEHSDVAPRGRQILLGLLEAGCEIEFAPLPELC